MIYWLGWRKRILTENNSSSDTITPNEGQSLGKYVRWGISLFGSIAGAAGLLYAVGFLVVNTSLLSYGVYEVGLLRERYVSAGAAFILLLTIIACFWFYFIPSGLFSILGKQAQNRSSLYRKLTLTILVILSLVLISFVATLILGFFWKISTDPGEWWSAIVGLRDADFRNQRITNILSTRPVFFWCVLVSLIFALFRSYMSWGTIRAALNGSEDQATEDEKGKESEDSLEAGHAPLSGRKPKSIQIALSEYWYYFVLTILLLLTLVVYARNVFPVLPAAMGGGLPIVVQFSAKTTEDLQELIQLGIPVEENKPNLTRQITLIAQTDNSYVVLVSHPELRQNVAVSILKEHVDGIIYYPEEYFLNDEYVAEMRTQKGRDALTQGDYQIAEDSFKEALDRKDNYLPALIGLGDTYVAKYIADALACEGDDCSIAKAIERYKEVLNQIRNDKEIESAIATRSKVAIFAEALYKLARAYALSPAELKEGDLNFPCHPESEDNEPSEARPYQSTIRALKCAIEVDNVTQTPLKYADIAKSDDAFQRRNAALRTNEDFVLLIFPSMENAVSGYSAEASKFQEMGKDEAALDRYTWAITITLETKLDLIELQEEQARLYFNRAGLYLDLHNAKSPRCVDNDCLLSAISDYKVAVQLIPNNAAYLTGLADAYRVNSNYVQAVKGYKQVTGSEELSRYAPAWLGLGETYILQEEFIQAREAFSQTIFLQSGNAAAYFGRALAQAKIGDDLDQIIIDLRQAITLDETIFNAVQDEPAFASINDIEDLLLAKRLFETGQMNERNGNTEDAIQKYMEAIKLDPNNDAYYAVLAEAYHKLPSPNWNEVEKAYLRAIELSVENDNYHFNLSETYAAQGKYEEAAEALATAIEINDEKAIYFDRLSSALFKIGLENEAFSAGEAAMELEPENLDYRFHLAEIYRQIKGWDRAIVNYDKIIKQDPEYGDAYCGMAIIYYQRGEREKAETAHLDCKQWSINDYLKEQAELARTAMELQQSGTGEGN